MGSGSGKGTSRSSSASNAVTTVNTDNRVYQSDFGAVKAGTDVANNALGGMVDVSLDAISLGSDALDASTTNLTRGLDFAADAYANSLTFAGDTTQNSLGFAGSLVDQLFSFTTNAIDTVGTQARNLASDSIAGNQSLAVATSESGDDKIVRIGMYAFAAIAAVLVLPAVFGKK